jgi:hypothetical protein
MIPFVREMEFRYGRADRVSPLIRRVVARNPGPFTFTGTRRSSRPPVASGSPTSSSRTATSTTRPPLVLSPKRLAP